MKKLKLSGHDFGLLYAVTFLALFFLLRQKEVFSFQELFGDPMITYVPSAFAMIFTTSVEVVKWFFMPIFIPLFATFYLWKSKSGDEFVFLYMLIALSSIVLFTLLYRAAYFNVCVSYGGYDIGCDTDPLDVEFLFIAVFMINLIFTFVTSLIWLPIYRMLRRRKKHQR